MNDRDDKPTGMLRRHAKAIIAIMIAVAFLAPAALVIVGGVSDGGRTDAGTTQTAGPDDTITDFTKLTPGERRRIVDGAPGANLTEKQKKEFIDTGMITTEGDGTEGDGTDRGTRPHPDGQQQRR